MRIITDELFNAMIAHLMKEEGVQIFHALVTSKKADEKPQDERQGGEKK